MVTFLQKFNSFRESENVSSYRAMLAILSLSRPSDRCLSLSLLIKDAHMRGRKIVLILVGTVTFLQKIIVNLTRVHTFFHHLWCTFVYLSAHVRKQKISSAARYPSILLKRETKGHERTGYEHMFLLDPLHDIEINSQIIRLRHL